MKRNAMNVKLFKIRYELRILINREHDALKNHIGCDVDCKFDSLIDCSISFFCLRLQNEQLN